MIAFSPEPRKASNGCRRSPGLNFDRRPDENTGLVPMPKAKTKPAREVLWAGEWFPIAKRLVYRCCGCGMKHTLRFRVGIKGRSLTMLVEDSDG